MLFLWITLYGLLYSLSGYLASALHAEAWLTAFSMSGYLLCLLCWICRTGRRTQLGLIPCRQGSIHVFLLLPLLILPVFNLIFTKPALPSVSGLLLTLSLCTAEELFFRGFLPVLLTRQRRLSGIFAAAALFALFHFGNLLAGWDVRYVSVQLVMAFFTGIFYCMVRLVTGSLYPCIAAHFLTNITAGPSGSLFWYLLLIPVFLLFTAALFRKYSSDPEVLP